MVYTSNAVRHTIYSELDEVHRHVRQKYDLQKKAANDIKKAKEMEKYLRLFKTIGNMEADDTGLQSVLAQEGMQEIINEVGKRLGIGKYNLFKNQHKWYLDSQARWGADDVFEAELATLLDVAADRAVGGSANGKTGVELIGSVVGNISKELFDELQTSGGERLISSSKKSNIINPPQFRAIKTDVTGYSATFQLSSTIAPQWQHFINLFTGARFTLKNYSSNSKYETIHLGNSNLIKAVLATLYNVGFDTREALHIYFHSTAKKYQGNERVEEHVQHLRFAYELAGGGLKDAEGNSLDEADFFIYNDPSSDNIWVRSTKEMIANVMDYSGGSIGSINSGVVIVKSAFN